MDTSWGRSPDTVNTGSIRHRRITVDRFGGPEALRVTDGETPPPAPGHTRIRVLAAGVGRTDLMARSGDYILQRRAPFTPGYEFVGEVVDHGDGAADDAPAPGTIVAAALPAMGAYTEYASVPTWLLIEVPTGMSPHTAASIPLDYLTAISLLDTHARVRTGDTVLIHGASGSVGAALVGLGHARGLRMYGTASVPAAIERLTGEGVTMIDYRRQDFETVIKQQEPAGITAVFDHLGGAGVRKGFRLLGPGGVLVSYAFAGRPGHMVADTVRGAALVTLMGLRPRRRTALCMVPREIRADHAWYRRTMRSLLDSVGRGDIDAPPTTTFPLREAGAAHAALEHREVSGKIVLTTA